MRFWKKRERLSEMTTEQWLLKEIQRRQQELHQAQDEQTRFVVKEILWLRRRWLVLLRANQEKKRTNP